jgi:hypothetical protein
MGTFSKKKSLKNYGEIETSAGSVVIGTADVSYRTATIDAHLLDGLIVAKVGHFRSSENPDTLNYS